MERFKTCAFLNIIENGVASQRKDALERMCTPFCKEECPVKLPILEFTGDPVVPYIEKFEDSRYITEDMPKETIDDFYVQGTA